MRSLVFVLVAVTMLAGSGLYAMEPASAGAGAGQTEPAGERARARQDLLNLKESYLPGLGEIEESDKRDYRYRARVPQEVFAEALKEMALDIDYPNFKNSVATTQGKARARLHGDVWVRLLDLQREDAP